MFQDPLIRILVLPLALLYGLGVAVRDFLYRHKLLVSVRFDVPIISVGNLSVGGAGKTPHIEYLIRLLNPYLEVAVLSRGYRRKTLGYQPVNVWNDAEQVGDEPLMYKRKFPDVSAAVCENRVLGIPQLLQQAPNTKVVLLDDAFQHRSVQAGLNILLTEYNRPFTRDFLLPSGRLREWRSAYRRADIIVVTKCPEDLNEEERRQMTQEINLFPHQKIFFSTYRYLTPYLFLNPNLKSELRPDTSVLLVCAIAHSDHLRAYLESRAGIVRVREFEDHHFFSESDLEDIERWFQLLPGQKNWIITTEKDAVRFELHRARISEKKWPLFVLPVEVFFMDQDGEFFNNAIKEFLLEFKI